MTGTDAGPRWEGRLLTDVHHRGPAMSDPVTYSVVLPVSEETVRLLRLDAKAIAAEAKLDGKFLLRSSDPHLSAEDIAAGYKQLLTVERPKVRVRPHRSICAAQGGMGHDDERCRTTRKRAKWWSTQRRCCRVRQGLAVVLVVAERDHALLSAIAASDANLRSWVRTAASVKH